MAVIDSLEVDIQAKSESVNKSLDDLVRRLGLVVEGISAIGQNKGLEDFVKKAADVTKGFQNVAKGISASVEPQMQKVAKSFGQITEQYKNLGKGFVFKGSASEIQKQVDKYTNSLEVAKLKKEELETAGKTEGEAYEAAVAKTIEYTNVIESLKQQLADVQAAQPQFNFNISGLEETRQAIESVGESIKEAVSIPESAFNYNAEAMTAVFGETASNIQNYAQAIDQFGQSAGQALNDSLQTESVEQKLKDFREQLKQLQVPKINEENLTKLQNELQKAKDKMVSLKTEMSNKLTMGKITESLDDKGYRNLREQIALTEKTIEALREKIQEVEAQSRRSGGLQKLGGLFSKLVAPVRLAMSALKGVASLLKKIGSFVGGAISKLSKLAKSFKGIKGASSGANASFGSSLKTVLKYTLGIRSLYTLFNKLRSAIKEGMKNLVQYSGEANASVSLLSNSMNQIKNASAAMAAPLLNAFAPAINQIIQLCIKAENSVNQLISSIMGKGTWIKAKVLTDDYAASVSKAGKAAKGSLRSFDELKTITTQEDEDSETIPEDMFETMEVENNFKNLAERLKEMWENADFTDLGIMIGEKIKGAIENIPWDSVKQTVSNVGKSFATLINGILEVPGLALDIGKTIGEAINTGITAINSFLDNTHWDSVGKFIGEGLNGIVNTIDWEGLGHLFATKWNAIFEALGNIAATFNWKDFGLKLVSGINKFITDFKWLENGTFFGNLVQGILNSLLTIVSGTKWGELGENIANSLNGIASSIHLSTLGETLGVSITGIFQSVIDFSKTYDWNALGTNIYEGINALFANTDFAAVGKGINDFAMGIFDTILVTIQGIDWMQVGSSIVDFILSIDWIGLALKLWDIGNALIDGLLKGILGALSGIGKWIKEHIFNPVVNWFKNLFGIHSPSTVFAELGVYLMQGLFNGISSLVQSVIDIFNKIKEKIVAVWGEIKAKTSEVWNSIKSFVSNLWNGLKLSASIAFNNIKTTITNIWNGIKTVTINIWNGIKEAVKVPINAIIGFINGMISGAVSGINGLINGFNTIVGIIPGFDLSISLIDAPQIPMLAKGAVLRGGNPFLAIVNDQKRGQTNVETPLKVIQEALREELTKFSAKVQIATPNMGMLRYEAAPAPSLAGAYGNYQYDTGAYTASYNNNNSDMSNVIEMAVYKGAYNAVSSAINNSKTLGDIKDLIEEGRTIEIDGSPIYQNMIKRARMDMRSGRNGRLVVAEELY